jgi:hypothetical protein
LINYRRGKTSNAVALGGELIDADGCLVVDTGDESIVPLWPEGFTLGNGGTEATLVDGDGRIIATIGDEVSLGGGPLDRNGAEDVVVIPIPAECAGDRFFAVAEVGS